MLLFDSKFHALKEKKSSRASGGKIRWQESVRHLGDFAGLGKPGNTPPGLVIFPFTCPWGEMREKES
jgi:hypothetical protein